jgi:hypothetical protein
MSVVKEQPPLFQIGDWVSFQYGTRKVFAEVVEDRGPIGVRGRRLYGLRLGIGLGGDLSEDVASFELPETELARSAPPLRRWYSIRYLRQGQSNDWRATTTTGTLVKGVLPKGVMGFTEDARRGGEGREASRMVRVEVLLEVDPEEENRGFIDPDGERPDEIERARSMADESFLAAHPRAKIIHEPPATTGSQRPTR